MLHVHAINETIGIQFFPHWYHILCLLINQNNDTKYLWTKYM